MNRKFYYFKRGSAILCLIALFVCKNSNAEIEKHAVSLNNTAGHLEIADPSIASIKIHNDLSVTVRAHKEGVTHVKFISIDKMEILANCKTTGNEVMPDVITRILTIGNSFSVDAVENYLYDLAKASKKPVIIGSLAIAGGSLDQHLSNARNNANPYIYTKIDENGVKTTKFDNTIESVLKSEPWDYISFQQVSQNSGMYSTFETPLPALLNYVKERATNRNVKYVLHQTWAYAQNSTHTGFANYGNDQLAMYEAIVDAYNKGAQITGIDIIIPAGTAIQNGRTSYIADNFTRDGYHLEETYGRYTAACTWFEKLFGESVVGNSFKPAGIADHKIEIAQHAAHFAVREPDKVTRLEHYQHGNSNKEEKGVLRLNFGSGYAPGSGASDAIFNGLHYINDLRVTSK